MTVTLFMRCFILLTGMLILSSGNYPLYSQSAPSLESIRDTLSKDIADTTRIRYNMMLGTYIFYTNIDTALYYWQKAAAIADDLKYSENEKLRYYADRTFGAVYSNIGVAFQYKGQYAKALSMYKMAFHYSQKIKDYILLNRVLNNIGIIKQEQEQFESALDYFQKSYELATFRKDSMSMSSTLNNMGITYKNMGQEGLAESYYKKSLDLALVLEYWTNAADNYVNLGDLKALEGRTDSALYYYELGLKLSNEIAYETALPNFYIQIAEIRLDEGKVDEAKKLGEDAREIAERLDMQEELKRVYVLLSEIYEASGDPLMALHYLKKDKKLNTEMFSNQKALKFGQMEVSYLQEKEKYDNYFAALKAREQEKARNYRQYLIAFGCLLVFAILMLFTVTFSHRTRLKKFIVFSSLLFFFEFVLVILDNYVDAYTGGLPFPKLMLNIVLAVMITPAHGYVEKFILRISRKKETVEPAQEQEPVSV